MYYHYSNYYYYLPLLHFRFFIKTMILQILQFISNQNTTVVTNDGICREVNKLFKQTHTHAHKGSIQTFIPQLTYLTY